MNNNQLEQVVNQVYDYCTHGTGLKSSNEAASLLYQTWTKLMFSHGSVAEEFQHAGIKRLKQILSIGFDKDLVIENIHSINSMLNQSFREAIGYCAPDTISVLGNLGLSEQGYNFLLYIDCETTGFKDTDEIIEISIINQSGKILFNSLVKPSVNIPDIVSDITGITNEMVANSPSWSEISYKVFEILNGKDVAIYNSDFDTRLLFQTCQLYGTRYPSFHPVCIMHVYAALFGEWNEAKGSNKWFKLEDALSREGINSTGTSHRALADTNDLRMLVNCVWGKESINERACI